MSLTRACLTVSLLSGLFAASARCDEPCTNCAAPAKQPRYTTCRGCNKKDKPPYVHPDVPFGYYPTVWMAWPGPSCAHAIQPVIVAPTIQPHVEPPVAPPVDIETLPPPRPADSGAPLKDGQLLIPIDR